MRKRESKQLEIIIIATENTHVQNAIIVFFAMGKILHLIVMNVQRMIFIPVFWKPPTGA